MSIANNNYINTLFITLPIFLVVLISWLILDYTQSGSIDGVLNDSDGLYWILLALGPAIIVGIPWSIIPMLGAFYGLIPMYGVFIAIFLSLYINGLIVTKRWPVTSIRAIPKIIGLVFLFVPLVIAVLIMSIAIGIRYL